MSNNININFVKNKYFCYFNVRDELVKSNYDIADVYNKQLYLLNEFLFLTGIGFSVWRFKGFTKKTLAFATFITFKYIIFEPIFLDFSLRTYGLYNNNTFANEIRLLYLFFDNNKEHNEEFLELCSKHQSIN